MFVVANYLYMIDILTPDILRLSKEWKIDPDNRYEEFLINHTMLSKKRSIGANRKFLKGLLYANVNFSAKAAEELIEKAAEKKIYFKDVYLKAKGVYSCKVVCVVDVKVFDSDIFGEVFDIAHSIEEENVMNDVSVEFEFDYYSTKPNAANTKYNHYRYRYAKAS